MGNKTWPPAGIEGLRNKEDFCQKILELIEKLKTAGHGSMVWNDFKDLDSTYDIRFQLFLINKTLPTENPNAGQSWAIDGK